MHHLLCAAVAGLLSTSTVFAVAIPQYTTSCPPGYVFGSTGCVNSLSLPQCDQAGAGQPCLTRPALPPTPLPYPRHNDVTTCPNRNLTLAWPATDATAQQGDGIWLGLPFSNASVLVAPANPRGNYPPSTAPIPPYNITLDMECHLIAETSFNYDGATSQEVWSPPFTAFPFIRYAVAFNSSLPIVKLAMFYATYDDDFKSAPHNPLWLFNFPSSLDNDTANPIGNTAVVQEFTVSQTQTVRFAFQASGYIKATLSGAFGVYHLGP